MYDVARGTHMEGMAGNCDPNQMHGLSPPSEAPLPSNLSIVNNKGASEEAPFAAEWDDFDFKRLHEYAPEELHDLFTDKDIGDIEAWHYLGGEDIDTVVDSMIEHPLPEYSNPNFSERLYALINNTGSYDDEVEDSIASDEIVQKLMARKREPNLQPEYIKQITRAFRVRRSILAHQYHE